MNRTRSERRHSRNRMKVKAAKIYRQWGCQKKTPGKYADNISMCSCPACGNPRKWRGERTRQELKAMCEAE